MFFMPNAKAVYNPVHTAETLIGYTTCRTLWFFMTVLNVFV
jgi:hypothetical protein